MELTPFVLLCGSLYCYKTTYTKITTRTRLWKTMRASKKNKLAMNANTYEVDCLRLCQGSCHRSASGTLQALESTSWHCDPGARGFVSQWPHAEIQRHPATVRSMQSLGLQNNRSDERKTDLNRIHARRSTNNITHPPEDIWDCSFASCCRKNFR
jgi:hypothetical protein